MIHVIVTCKGRLQHLKQTAPVFLSHPSVEYTLVDYGCPDKSGNWLREQKHPRATIVYTTKNDEIFNLSKARNLGVKKTQGWLWFADADTLVKRTFITHVLRTIENAQSKHGYLKACCSQFWIIGERSTPLDGNLIVHRAAFDAVGGYDEAMQNYAYDDWRIRLKLIEDGCKQNRILHAGASHIEHGDDLRGKYYELCLKESAAQNYAYIEKMHGPGWFERLNS